MNARASRLLIVLALACARTALAEVDLVTLPKRQSVQLTIYNSADLTLVRDVRNLTLKKGGNRLSFSWANTLIDPTSLDLRALKNAADVDLMDVTYPPRVKQMAVWNVQSRLAGPAPVEITYFTSGISWRAFYMATLAPDEKAMLLQGYVRVTNNSGEDYEEAQTRLVVGKIHILDQIAALAQRFPPYGRPGPIPVEETVRDVIDMDAARPPEEAKQKIGHAKELLAGEGRPREIVKEGLSEYFLYTIEGTETIPTGWSKRLPSFRQDSIPIENLYKYDENRWGRNVIRFLYFKNDEEHKLGQTPLPDGMVKVYRRVDEAGHLSYEGQCGTKYIPVDQKAELNLGPARHVMVEPKLMEYSQSGFMFNNNQDISGWDESETWQMEVKNHRDVAVRIEITRHFKHQYWSLKREGDHGEYEKDDATTIKFTMTLAPHTTKTFRYTVTYSEGTRREK